MGSDSLLISAFAASWRRNSRHLNRFGILDRNDTCAQIEFVPHLILQMKLVQVFLQTACDITQLAIKPFIKCATGQHLA